MKEDIEYQLIKITKGNKKPKKEVLINFAGFDYLDMELKHSNGESIKFEDIVLSDSAFWEKFKKDWENFSKDFKINNESEK